ncbi:FAD-dependent monooxygenase [Brevibacterium sp.]|uniref:FAD-dependent monooxygenase n=1 Tax=Brevibacterium sp. TaxID=1701 RepID=UPI0025B9EECC|nr:FAD-dependent monooxygenase [Brevibacterium sp.]
MTGTVTVPEAASASASTSTRERPRSFSVTGERTRSSADPLTEDTTADVVVVGAGPGGSALAAHLAGAGMDVVLLEKSAFPRDKVCGDALTPRAVKELGLLGVPTPADEGWHRNRGLRLIGGGHRVEIDWPGGEFPDYGLTKARTGLDETLARFAQARGARLHEQTMATEPLTGADGWITGIRTVARDSRGRRTGAEAVVTAPLVVACDGVSSRTAVSMGREKRDDRPMGVAVRTYHSSPRHADPYLESWVELRAQTEGGLGGGVPGRRTARGRTADGRGTSAQAPGEALPGYGWLFPLGDGTVNVGLGILDTSPQFGTVDYRQVLREWIGAMGHEWEIDETTQLERVRSAALPMGFNRTPHFADGLMLVGDSAGMVSPFNGEGIDYALESARIAADVIVTHQHKPRAAWRRALAEYPAIVRETLGGYVTLGRAFAALIGRPELMGLAIKYGMSVDALMAFAVRLMGNIQGNGRDADLADRVIAALVRAVPKTTND